MLAQQDTWKPGERCPEGGRYYCVSCDRAGHETIVELEEMAPFPLCSACLSAGRGEVDQLWDLLSRREVRRRQERTRWREMWET